MRTASFALLLLFLIAPTAQASYREYCKVEGVIETAPKSKDGISRFVLKVISSKSAQCGKRRSYNLEICHTYAGKSLTVSLTVESVGKLAVGNNVALIRHAWDQEFEPTGPRVEWELPGDCE